MEVYREFLRQFCSEQLLCFLESFVPYEFTVLPSLKCLGRASAKIFQVLDSMWLNSRWSNMGVFTLAYFTEKVGKFGGKQNLA